MTSRIFRSSLSFSLAIALALLTGCSDNGETYQFRKPGTDVNGIWQVEADGKCQTGVDAEDYSYQVANNILTHTQFTILKLGDMSVLNSPIFGDLVLFTPRKNSEKVATRYGLWGIAYRDHGDYLEAEGVYIDGKLLKKVTEKIFKDSDGLFRKFTYCPDPIVLSKQHT